jgi:exosome complex component RRP42
MSCKLPVFEVQDNRVIDTGAIKPAPVTTIPVSITSARIGESIVLDPTAEEEACMDARITITTNSDNHFTAVQKGATGTFTSEQIKSISETARLKGQEVRNKIKELTRIGE